MLASLPLAVWTACSVVALVAQVREQESAEPGVQEVRGQIRGEPIRQVSAASPDPLLDGPRVRTLAQHELIVIRLEHDEVTPRERGPDGCGGPSQVGRHSQLETAVRASTMVSATGSAASWHVDEG